MRGPDCIAKLLCRASGDWQKSCVVEKRTLRDWCSSRKCGSCSVVPKLFVVCPVCSVSGWRQCVYWMTSWFTMMYSLRLDAGHLWWTNSLSSYLTSPCALPHVLLCSLQRYGRLLKMCKDPLKGTIWAFTSQAVFKYKVVREARCVNLSRLYAVCGTAAWRAAEVVGLCAPQLTSKESGLLEVLQNFFLNVYILAKNWKKLSKEWIFSEVTSSLLLWSYAK